ncbi:S8 family peptidase [Rheinheimera sp. 4Y26]|uniref:S8 family peptidase n=1 Tax=Rheinheimera sp. 4Y26 TaxID=2977811 RepID=UPI0021B0FAE1|nr:S8 family peptidase [Rheinheimera sp. 4Y26]MCT6699683.1 S8 family peptidase [Rheinheimera sp. 4Y26]
MMQPIQKILPLLFTVTALALSVQQAVASDNEEFMPLSGDDTQYMIKFKPGSTIKALGPEADSYLSAGERKQKFSRKGAMALLRQAQVQEANHLDAFGVSVAKLNAQQLQALKNNPMVDYVEEDPKRYLLAESVPYGITMVQAPQVSDAMTSNIKACVIDTGYNYGHPDLPGSGVTGYAFSGHGSWSTDGNGHGTHVAGTIAAIGGNNIGVVGVNRSAKLGLHIVKIFNDSGKWTTASNLIQAIQSCKNAGASVVNMSLGGSSSSTTESNAMTNFYNGGMLLVAAAGNAGTSAFSYPASYSAVMSVAAVNSSKVRASFSQYNSQVEISGPGVSVNSTYKNSTYASLSGTSMASPHVAGVAALVWSQHRTCSAAKIRAALNATAEDRGTAGRDTQYGWGIVRAKAAVDYLNVNRC